MKRLLEAQIIANYQVRLVFDDGAQGIVDLSTEPMTGVFTAWKDPQFFHQMRVGNAGRCLEWPGDLDLCADSLWCQATGTDPLHFFGKQEICHA